VDAASDKLNLLRGEKRKPQEKEHLDIRGQVKLTLKSSLKGSQKTHNLPPYLSCTP